MLHKVFGANKAARILAETDFGAIIVKNKSTLLSVWSKSAMTMVNFSATKGMLMRHEVDG